MRAPFSYVGGKGKLAKKLLPYLAIEEKMYVEPYFGAGGIFFAKPPAPTEYINDLNGDVVNFMRVLRDHPHELLRLCQLTPYARDEYYRCRDEEWPDTETHEGRLEAARRFWVLAKQGRASPNRADANDTSPVNGEYGWYSQCHPSENSRATNCATTSHDQTGPIDGDGVHGWYHGCRPNTPTASTATGTHHSTGPIGGERGWTGDCRSEQNPRRINRATTTRDDTGPIDEAGWKSAERKGGTGSSSKAVEMAQDSGPSDGEWGWFTQCLPEHNSRSHNPATTSRDQTGPIDGEFGWKSDIANTALSNAATEIKNSATGPIDGEHGWAHGCRSETYANNATAARDEIGPIDGERGWKPADLPNQPNSNYATEAINFPHLLQVAQRLQGVTIDNRDAIKIIERYDRSYAFLYLDPPYMLSTRRGNLYKYEMSDEQHVTLLEAALAYTGKVAISGYANDLYDTMLAGWQRIEIPTKLSIVTNSEGKKNDRIEILWTNYRKQPALF